MSNIPKLVFIIPYRDRELQKNFFLHHMTHTVLADMPIDSYQIYFVHQQDTRTFNRGALKNIGFLVLKELYPDDYKDITIVFNDVDTMPYVKNFLPYETNKGMIKHFYGFQFTLGGIVSITAEDFETLGGFPNFWSWGYEDNELQRRAKMHHIDIDRSAFYPIMNKEIIHLQDGYLRDINITEKKRYDWKTTEGFADITDLSYTIEDHMIQVSQFHTPHRENSHAKQTHDLRTGNQPFTKKTLMSMKMV